MLLGLAPKSINALAIDSSSPGALYVASNTFFPFFDAGKLCFSLFKTINGGTSWTVVNSGLINGAIDTMALNTLAIDPSTPTTVYAGTSWSGVFKSTNGGSNWTAFNSGWVANRWAKRAGLPSFREEYQIVNVLAIDPSSPSTLYAGTSFEGVFKSTNGGSWTATNSGLGDNQVFALAIDPSNPATLYAGTHGGVFKSTNAGRSWIAVNAGLSNRDIHALAIDPSRPATLYAGSNGGGVFKSTNGGTTWLPAGSAIGNAILPAKARSSK
jgi:photosystem II stability/assembly factor-like uncharacterized protein